MSDIVQQKSTTTQNGFTLIEVLVVLIVMGLIVIPSFGFFVDFSAKHRQHITEEKSERRFP